MNLSDTTRATAPPDQLRVVERKLVVLEHDHPFLHWDLLIEHGATLLSWRLLQPPRANHWLPAERLPDHRRHYLNYEGPVSGGRGSVVRILCATLVDVGIDWSAVDDTGTFTLKTGESFAELCGRQLQSDHPEWRFG